MPKTDKITMDITMDTVHARQAMRDLADLLQRIDEYRRRWQRDPISDAYTLERLTELVDCGDVESAPQTMQHFLQEGTSVPLLGTDPHWQSANAETFDEEVERAVVDAGLWLDATTGEPVEPPVRCFCGALTHTSAEHPNA